MITRRMAAMLTAIISNRRIGLVGVRVVVVVTGSVQIIHFAVVDIVRVNSRCVCDNGMYFGSQGIDHGETHESGHCSAQCHALQCFPPTIFHLLRFQMIAFDVVLIRWQIQDCMDFSIYCVSVGSHRIRCKVFPLRQIFAFGE